MISPTPRRTEPDADLVAGVDRRNMRVLQVLPSVGSGTDGPVRSTVANCLALHGVDLDVRFTLVTADVGLEEDWCESLEARFQSGAEIKVFPGFGRLAFMMSPRHAVWPRSHGANFVVVHILLHRGYGSNPSDARELLP